MTNDILSTIIPRIVVEGLSRHLKDSCFWEKFMKIYIQEEPESDPKTYEEAINDVDADL
jgi:hypothetical protein